MESARARHPARASRRGTANLPVSEGFRAFDGLPGDLSVPDRFGGFAHV